VIRTCERCGTSANYSYNDQIDLLKIKALKCINCQAYISLPPYSEEMFMKEGQIVLLQRTIDNLEIEISSLNRRLRTSENGAD
jgi:hypothetical protein